MPVLFIGHGSPMNGIEENDFTAGWQKSVSNQERRCQEQERTLF